MKVDQNHSRARYGLDAPMVILNLTCGGLFVLIVGVIAFFFLKSHYFVMASIILALGILYSISLLIPPALMVYSSWYGKKQVLNILISMLHLRGNENILDIGCGRGMLLVEIAKKVRAGRVTGVDIWNPKDQSGNQQQTTELNVQLEGVGDLVNVVTTDMRSLPFENDSFDNVVSSLAIHNLPSTKDRRRALTEMYRVLKPGGEMAILDFQHLEEYNLILVKLGLKNLKLSKKYYRMFPPTRIITGKK